MKHYVVLDLEMCMVPKTASCSGYGKANETIQIGAVLLDESFQVINSFDSYVKPEFGRLTYFVHNLTGITQSDLADAAPFAEVLERFVSWIPEGDVEMVSWSLTDKSQLVSEMHGKRIVNARLKELFEHWTDSQELFAQRIGEKRSRSLEEALNLCDVQVNGRAHDGYFDAYNTALLFKKLMTEKELKLNQYYIESKKEETTHLSCTLGDMLKGFDFEGALAG